MGCNQWGWIVRAIGFALGALGLMGAAFVSTPASASTQCQGNVQNIWAGDGGNVWITLTNGGSVDILPNDPNREAALSLATTAMITGHQIVVRYAADNVACTAQGRTDFVGLYLI